ncbi:hypothetical protein ACH5RR_037532 [Cinchona calisaya]|uniref:Uncharacterized protein n=1 Tax=Cinchona calisaya TaxID=153742 RepID=A0ABD2Y6G2_9GENT
MSSKSQAASLQRERKDRASGEGAQTAFGANVEDRANRASAQTAFEVNVEMEVEESMNLEESFGTNPESLEDGEINILPAQQRSKSKVSCPSKSCGTKRKFTSS